MKPLNTRLPLDANFTGYRTPSGEGLYCGWDSAAEKQRYYVAKWTGNDYAVYATTTDETTSLAWLAAFMRRELPALA